MPGRVVPSTQDLRQNDGEFARDRHKTLVTGSPRRSKGERTQPSSRRTARPGCGTSTAPLDRRAPRSVFSTRSAAPRRGPGGPCAHPKRRETPRSRGMPRRRRRRQAKAVIAYLSRWIPAGATRTSTMCSSPPASSRPGGRPRTRAAPYPKEPLRLGERRFYAFLPEIPDSAGCRMKPIKVCQT